MIRKKKRKIRKNPHVDDTYIRLLYDGLTYGGFNLPNIIQYYNIGEICDDCDKKYYDCTCEGSREKSGKYCEECQYNKCICDFDIWDDEGYEDYQKIKWVIWNIAKKTLNDKELIYLVQKIVKTLNSEGGRYSPYPLSFENKLLRFTDYKTSNISVKKLRKLDLLTNV